MPAYQFGSIGIPVDQRDGRYVWGNSACGPSPGSVAGQMLGAASQQPFSRLSPYEAMYHSLHSSPSALSSALRFSPAGESGSLIDSTS